METLKTLLKILAGLVVGVVLAYLVAGYMALGWAFRTLTGNETKENKKQESVLEKNRTGEKKKGTEKINTVPTKGELPPLEPTKKKRKKYAPMTPERLQQMRELDGFMTFADDIVKKNPNFNPCASICRESTLHVPSSEEAELPERMRWIMEQYSRSEEQFLKNPRINYMLLNMSNIRSVMLPDMMETAFQILGKDAATLENDSALKAKILLQLPIWIYQMKDNIAQGSSRNEITRSFMKLHESCRKKTLAAAQAQQQCNELFSEYDTE